MKKKVSIGLISGPLGDVRHTAHVGHSDGDVFGDTTFLQVCIQVFMLICIYYIATFLKDCYLATTVLFFKLSERLLFQWYNFSLGTICVVK